MKNSTSKSNFPDSSSSTEEERIQELQKKTNFSSKAVKSTMTEQLIVPPARVWDKIEKILDEQDARRNNANTIIAASFGRVGFFKRKSFYLATIAGLGIAAGVVWMVV